MNTLAANLLGASPYGRQAGKESSAGLSVSHVRPDPSEFMTYIWACSSIPSEVKAMRVLSGDHFGASGRCRVCLSVECVQIRRRS
jgi:hypothetical protein